MFLLVCFLCLASAASHDRPAIWARAASTWIRQDLGSDKQSLPDSSFRVYLALPTPKGRYVAISADGGTRHSGRHDAIIVLDPHPLLRFAHPTSVFFVDLHFSQQQCDGVGGRLLDGGDCLQIATRRRCHRRVAGRSGCHKRMMYLPEARVGAGGGDFLSCHTVPGFHPHCPPLRPLTLNPPLHCDPLHSNSKACDTTTYLRTDCPFMQTCDHAILLSGGWNRQVADESSLKNIQKMSKMLQENGFLEKNIKIFYANGLNKTELENNGLALDVYPSGLKLGLRYHLRTLCETSRCADSLVIYLNSPAKPDGASLLWDSDGNGEYDETELYSVRELLRDVQDCTARRVIIISDQTYSSELINAASRNHMLKNIVIVGASMFENTHRDRLTKHFLETRHESTCLRELVETYAKSTQTKDTWFGGSWSPLLNATISGGPCASDELSQDEIKRRYFGCQNLSTLEMLEPDQADY